MAKISCGAAVADMEGASAGASEQRTAHIPYFEADLAGPFSNGKELSIADLFLYSMSLMISSGFLDHVPTDTLAGYPKLVALFEAVKAHPAVVAYSE